MQPRVAEYIRAATSRATLQGLEDGTVYAEIPGLDGVWANAETEEKARAELAEVLEEWIYLRLSEHLDIPVMDGIEIKAPSIA